MIAYVANVYIFGVVISLLLLGAYKGHQQADSGEFTSQDMQGVVLDALCWPLLFAVPLGTLFTLLWRSRHNSPAAPPPGGVYKYSISYNGVQAPATPCTVTVPPPVGDGLATPGLRYYRGWNGTFIDVSKKTSE